MSQATTKEQGDSVPKVCFFVRSRQPISPGGAVSAGIGGHRGRCRWSGRNRRHRRRRRRTIGNSAQNGGPLVELVAWVSAQTAVCSMRMATAAPAALRGGARDAATGGTGHRRHRRSGRLRGGGATSWKPTAARSRAQPHKAVPSGLDGRGIQVPVGPTVRVATPHSPSTVWHPATATAVGEAGGTSSAADGTGGAGGSGLGDDRLGGVITYGTSAGDAGVDGGEGSSGGIGGVVACGTCAVADGTGLGGGGGDRPLGEVSAAPVAVAR